MLGHYYLDTVTGFEGKATGHCTFLHGTDQVQLENKEGMRWFEVERLHSRGPEQRLTRV